MPHKEPLTREKKSWAGRPTGDVTLTSRAKTKLRAQISKAERIMRVETNADRSTSKVFYTAQRMKARAQKLLGDKSSPGEKVSDKGDKYQKRREPIEKVTGVQRIRKQLEAAGKAGLKKSGG